jgi:hypothetical protein
MVRNICRNPAILLGSGGPHTYIGSNGEFGLATGKPFR